MCERYEMKVYDGTDPNASPSWWEGWPLTVVAVLFAAAHYWALSAAVWSLFQ